MSKITKNQYVEQPKIEFVEQSQIEFVEQPQVQYVEELQPVMAQSAPQQDNLAKTKPS